MDLEADLQSARVNRRKRGTPCSVGVLLEELEGEKDGHLVQEAIGDVALTHEALSRVLRKHGWNVSGCTVGRHRRRTVPELWSGDDTCACEVSS